MLDYRVKHNPHVFMTYCCQHCINTGLMVDARIVMRWMRVSKPTALDILNEYTEKGYLERFTTQHRPNAVKYNYRPQKSVFTAYRKGEYRNAYLQFMSVIS